MEAAFRLLLKMNYTKGAKYSGIAHTCGLLSFIVVLFYLEITLKMQYASKNYSKKV